MLEQIISFDNAAVQALQSFSNPSLNFAMALITLLGNPVFWLVVAAFLYWQGKEKQSFHLITIITISAVFAGALKEIFMRARPSAQAFKIFNFDNFESYSFPSGHSTLITSMFFYLKKNLSKTLKIIFIILIALVALSRIFLGMHYPSDIIAGIILGAIIGNTYYYFVETKKLTVHLTKKKYTIAIIALVTTAVLFVGFLSSVPLGAALIGYYSGFFASREIGLHSKKAPGKKFAIKQLIGFIILGIIFLSTLSDSRFAIIQYGIAGLWVSFLWPLIFEKTIQHS